MFTLLLCFIRQTQIFGIKYLTFFIRRNGAKAGNELALSKWKADLAFVQEYDINIQPRAIISEIKKYGK